MNKRSTKTTIFLVALALASSANAFVPQASTKVVDTQLNALWRNWIPQTADMMDLVAGSEEEDQNRHEFVVVEPLDESDTGLSATKRRTVSLLSKSKDSSPSPSNRPSNNIRPALWAVATAATLLLASSTFVQASFAVSGGGSGYAGQDLSNQDFSNQIFKGKDFTQVLARNTNFAGSNLAGCRFPNAYLVNANYEGADIRGVSFEQSNMENVNLKVSEILLLKNIIF